MNDYAYIPASSHIVSSNNCINVSEHYYGSDGIINT